MQNPQRQAVEDDALDVIRKAMAGLTADGWVFQKNLHRLVNTLSHSLLAGDMNPSDWDEVATHLQLHAPSLLALASDPTVPSIPLPFDWQVWNLPFGPLQCKRISDTRFSASVHPVRCRIRTDGPDHAPGGDSLYTRCSVYHP